MVSSNAMAQCAGPRDRGRVVTDAPERPGSLSWLPYLNGVVGASLCIAMALRFAETTPTYFSMGLTLIAVVLISGGSSAQIQGGLMKIGLRLISPAAKALSDAAEKEKDK